MILKIFMLLVVMSYYHNYNKAMNAALLWGGMTLLFGLMFDGFELEIILWSVVSFVVALGIFTLLDYLDGKAIYWPALIAGIVGLVFLA